MHRLLIGLFVCLLFLPHVMEAKNAVIQVTDKMPYTNITQKVYCWFNPDNRVKPDSALIQTQLHSEPYGKSYFDVNHRTYYWVYVPMVNTSGKPQNIIFEIDNPHIDTLYFWTYTNKKLSFEAPTTGDYWAFNTRLIAHRNFLLPLTIMPGDTIEILTKICKYGQPMALQFSLAEQECFYSASNGQFGRHMIVLGILLYTVLLMTVFSIYLQRYSLLFLVAAMICLILEALWQLGYGYQYVFKYVTFLNNYMRISFVNSFVVFNAIYVYSYTRIQKFDGRWVMGLWVCVIILLTFLLCFFVLAYFQVNSYSPRLKAFFLFANAFYILTFALILMALHKYDIERSSKIAKYMKLFYTIAIIFMLLSLVMLTIPKNLLPYPFIKHISLISCAVFVLISLLYSVRLAYDIFKETEELKEKANFALIEGQEKERERIARDLHDGISASILALRNFLAATHFNNPLEQQRLVHLATEIGNEVRNLSHSLIPLAITNGKPFSNLIEDVCKLMKQSMPDTDLNHYISIPPNIFQDKPAYRVMIYRIVQEILTNLAKHAKAKKALLKIYLEDKKLYLLLFDDGVGFDPNKQFEGIGLQNIKNYVSYMHGNIKIHNMQNGVSIQIVLPLK